MTCACAAASQEESPDRLAAELAALRAQVAALRLRADESRLDAIRAEQVRAIVRDALADSATRSSWSGAGADGALAGYDPARGFFLGIADRGESVRAFGFAQVRFTWNDGYDAAARTPAADDLWGMEIRRAQLFVTGQLDGPQLTWLIGLCTGSFNDPVTLQALQESPAAADGTPPSISYLNITRQLGGGWYGQVGSIFTPFTYESHLFSTAQTQMGECSYVEWLFTADFTTGVNLGYGDESIQWQLCYGDQIGTAPGAWDDASNQSVALSSRLNWKLCGTWEQYALETSFPGQPFGAFAGIAGRYQVGRGINPASLGGANPKAVTGDLALMFGGANLILQGIWADQWVERGGSSWGALVQGGAFVARDVEAFMSLGMADVLGTQGALSVGANWYVDRQSVKVTGRAIVPVAGNPAGVTADVLPPQGLAGGPSPNNNVSLVLQLQVGF